MENIIKLLLKAGFEKMAPLSSPSGNVSRIAGNRFVATKINIRQKYKYPHGNIRVTVGKRTVCFYRVHQKKAVDFQNYKTTEVENIKYAIREIQNRYSG